jgi:hypothetical protein
MTICVHLCQYREEFFLEWEIFQAKCRGNQKHLFNSQKIFLENRAGF